MEGLLVIYKLILRYTFWLRTVYAIFRYSNANLHPALLLVCESVVFRLASYRRKVREVERVSVSVWVVFSVLRSPSGRPASARSHRS